MKLMAIIGSPRKGGNTELLINQVIAGCRSKTDVDLEKLFVVERKIEYCNGCMSCTPKYTKYYPENQKSLKSLLFRAVSYVVNP